MDERVLRWVSLWAVFVLLVAALTLVTWNLVDPIVASSLAAVFIVLGFLLFLWVRVAWFTRAGR